MEESPSSVKVERKSRKKPQFFSTEAPYSFLPTQRSTTAESFDQPVEQIDSVKEKLDDDEDLKIRLEGMEIDNLAVNGATAMNALSDVLHKIGIDMSGHETPIKNLKQMSPWEIKSNIQTQIIVHLGRRMEKMQEIVDDLNAKLSATITQKHRIKLDRDETRARLAQVTAELKESTKLQKQGGNKGLGLFDEHDLVNTVLADLRNAENLPEESLKTHAEDHSDVEKDIQKNESEDEDEPLEELLEMHSNTKDQLRKMIAIMQVKKKYDPPSKLGVGLKSLITDEDIMSLNPFRRSIRTPYKLDALNYQPKEAHRLIRQATNQVEYLSVSLATRQQQLTKAKDNNEKISILEEQSAQTMDSLSVCLDLLCEEQVYAWKWRSRCKQLGRQLEEIRNLFSRVNVEANRMARKEQKMVGSIIYKDYKRSSIIKTIQTAPPKTPTSPNLGPIRSSRPVNMHSRSHPRNFSTTSACSDSSSRPHTSVTIQSIDISSTLSKLCTPELDVGYIPSLD